MPRAENNSLNPAVRMAMDEIASDNTSGAAEILRRAANIFSLLNTMQIQLAGGGAELARRAVLDTSVELVRAQPDMCPLVRLASATVSASRLASTASEVLISAEDAARKLVESAAAKARSAALHAADLIRDRSSVLTHSRSSTVIEAFINARRNGRYFSVIATESRPMFEGRTLAKTLSAEGIQVTLIADAAASLIMDRTDFVMLGADKITPLNLVNKIGTRMTALAARERGLPIYVVCDTLKFIPADYAWGSDCSRSPDELWPDAPGEVVVLNRYFEPTPLSHLTAIVTEDGALSPEEASRRAEAVRLDQLLLDALK